MNILLIGVIILINIYNADSQCTFPSDLRGNWISADRGILTFTSNAMSNYPIQLSVSVSSMDFNCDTLINNQYYLRGTNTFDVFSKTLRAHICIEFGQITSDKFYYFIATAIETTVNERIYVAEDILTVTHSDVCNRQQPYEVGTYMMLIRDGASESSLAITCPSDILRTFENVYMETADSTTSCSGSRLDTCTDKTTMNFTYNSCASSLTFSAGGAFRCIYNTASGGTTYLAVLNVDATLVPTQTYRIVCYTLKWHDQALRTTAYPGSCRLNQTSTSVVTPGVVMSLSDVSEPQVRISRRRKRDTGKTADPVYGADLVPYYVGAVAFALLLFGCAGIFWNYRHYKKADKPNRIRTIQVKEIQKQQHRESTSGIFSCSSTSIEEMDFITTSTPIPYHRSKQAINTPPTSLTGVLHPRHEYYTNNRIHNNIYDEIHYTYVGKNHLTKTQDVQTSEDFYRNYRSYANKEIPIAQKQNNTNHINRSMVAPVTRANNSYVKTLSAKNNNVASLNPGRQSGRSKISKTDVDGPTARGRGDITKTIVDGPTARGRGDITNTVHYFNMRIPMHWR